jgi:hypothetical protein
MARQRRYNYTTRDRQQTETGFHRTLSALVWHASHAFADGLEAAESIVSKRPQAARISRQPAQDFRPA